MDLVNCTKRLDVQLVLDVFPQCDFLLSRAYVLIPVIHVLSLAHEVGNMLF